LCHGLKMVTVDASLWLDSADSNDIGVAVQTVCCWTVAEHADAVAVGQ
jgi:hypothetical protein